ncbi:hypothetical protein DN730_13330 [Marinomonas piezotolerans]|uniref:Lipocalin-like domain-containing protein n=1 Tax=Marinomonas piezotolerans TaxID=2213058 RepID=A0A370U7J2_9GAMM|nr:hypothetical protein [Marinomonas piezotolerans]RDL43723.1 hypothetical protein DN730_13330 [Marinomonas piezotolerans]
MKALLLPVAASVFLTACGGGGSSSESTSTNTVINGAVGYWHGTSSIYDNTYESVAFVNESGFTFINAEGSIVYGDLNWNGNTGTGILYEIDGDDKYTYDSTVSFNNGALSASLKYGSDTFTFAGTGDAENNNQFKKSRDLSDLNGTWYQYDDGASDTFTMTNGVASLRSLELGCLVTVVLKDEDYRYSAFSMTATASECTDDSLNGSYSAGLAVSGSEDDVETLTLFAYRDDAWIGGDFYRE